MKTTRIPTPRQMAIAISGVLALGRTYLHSQATGGQIAQAGEGMGLQGHTQTITRADVAMQAWLPERFAALTFLDGVQFEGEKRQWFGEEPHGLSAFCDEVDGSQNQCIAAQQLLHCAVVTLMDVPADGVTTFRHIVAAVMLNYLDGSVIYAFRNEDGSYTTETIGVLSIVPLDKRPKLLVSHPSGNLLDVGNHPFFTEQYYPAVREVATLMFSGIKGNLRSMGNSAWEAVYAALGHTLGFLSTQKLDEVGAIYAIARGAGAFVTTFDGSPHDDLPLAIGSKGNIDLLVAPTEEVGRHVLALYSTARTELERQQKMLAPAPSST